MRGDLEWASIPALARSAAERFGDKDAVDRRRRRPVVRRRSPTQAARVGRAFIAAGLEPGDRVAIWSPNIHEWIVALLGLQSAGGVLVPINTRYKGAEAAYVLQTSRAKALVTVNGFLGNEYLAMLEGHDLPHLEHRIVLRGDVPDGAVGGRRLPRRWASRCPRPSSTRGSRRSRPTTWPTSSSRRAPPGTRRASCAPTARPCGASPTGPRSSGCARTTATSSSTRSSTRSGTRRASWPRLTVGATLVPQAVFDIPEAAGQRGPPPDHRAARARRRSTRRSSTTPTSTARSWPRCASPSRARRRCPSSCSSGWTTSSASRRWSPPTGSPRPAGSCRSAGPTTRPRRSPGSSGRAIPGVEVRVVDDDGAEVPRGEPGEIVVRGYNVMREYFEDPERTAETIDADGWLHTGDIGTMDARRLRGHHRPQEGHVHRRRLQRLPGRDREPAAGPPRPRPGGRGRRARRAHGRGRAWPSSCPPPASTPDPDEVVAWAREHMANYKVPRRVRGGRRAPDERVEQGPEVPAPGPAAAAAIPDTPSGRR